MALAWWSRVVRFWRLARSSRREPRRAAAPFPRPPVPGIERLADRTLLSGMGPSPADVVNAYGQTHSGVIGSPPADLQVSDPYVNGAPSQVLVYQGSPLAPGAKPSSIPRRHEDASWRSANLFQDLLPHADPPLREGPAATGPHEAAHRPEGQFVEVNQAEGRAAGVSRAFDAGEDDPGPEGWVEGAAVDALGVVGADPPFRIIPDGAPPAPEVHFVPVENRDLAVVAALLAGDSATGAESGTTGPGGREVPPLPAPPTTIVVGVDPTPDESPADGPGEPGCFTGRPQATPDPTSGPWSSMRRDPGDPNNEGPLSAAHPAPGEGGFRSKLRMADGGWRILWQSAIRHPPSAILVCLLGLWYGIRDGKLCPFSPPGRD